MLYFDRYFEGHILPQHPAVSQESVFEPLEEDLESSSKIVDFEFSFVGLFIDYVRAFLGFYGPCTYPSK